MSSSIAASFNTTVGSTLESFISTATTTSSSTGLFGLLQSNVGGSSTSSGLLGDLQNSTESGSAATSNALTRGSLTSSQHNVITAIAAAPNGVLSQAWNSNGTEPSTLTTLRSYGWIKLTGKSYDAATKTTQGNYVLTSVGQAIYARTGGGAVSGSGSSSLSAATLNGSSSTSSLSSASASTIASILNGLGFTTTSVAALTSGTSSTSSSSSSTTGSAVSLLT